jgi:hypothetical protein
MPTGSKLRATHTQMRAKLRKHGRTFEKSYFLNFLDKKSDFGSSLAKNFPSEERTSEEFSASIRDFFRAKNYPAKKYLAKNYLAKNNNNKRLLAKNFPS